MAPRGSRRVLGGDHGSAGSIWRTCFFGEEIKINKPVVVSVDCGEMIVSGKLSEQQLKHLHWTLANDSVVAKNRIALKIRRQNLPNNVLIVSIKYLSDFVAELCPLPILKHFDRVLREERRIIPEADHHGSDLYKWTFPLSYCKIFVSLCRHSWRIP